MKLALMAAKETRWSFTVTLYPEEEKAVDAIARELGMKKTLMVARLVRWFAAQEQSRKLEILRPTQHEDEDPGESGTGAKLGPKPPDDAPYTAGEIGKIKGSKPPDRKAAKPKKD